MKRTWKKFLSIFVAAILLFGTLSATACNSENEENNTMKFVDKSNQNIQYVVFMVTNVYY